ncbi:uncharacterized protein C15orf39 homolog isoform X2 [Scophthalmus maximus]|uniref:uncharacterized protein C15orf39 homolog isoform X2 n=1 Tax=Scophthalmus maximus TaxID=52904 RepID=UPI001FA8D492|nr:uncharacterized protein C15orf39 homolog isoform X2 [Scophthalmus maximus]
MMNSQSMQTLIGPVIQSKMPLFNRTIAATVLSKPQNMSGFLDKQTMQYSGAYFTYDPRLKDGAAVTSPWSNSKTSLLDGRSPMSHLSGMEGQNPVFYRQDSGSSEEGHSHSPSVCHAPVKQGFTLYTKSPGISTPIAATPVAVRKQTARGENASPASENSVYLAIPKPVYRYNPCCNDLGCVMGQRYTMEHGSPRIPNTVYEQDWMHTDAHYAEREHIQRKTREALLQQRGLQFDPSAEPLKRAHVETYGPSTVMIDPNYSSYPCTPTRTLFGSLSEQSQRLQTSPRGYPSLYPSHPTYEHMTSEVYQERSPMSKYGPLTQHPVFYYSQANEEVQNSTRCKNIGSKQREDVPVILKRTISNPREHYTIPQSLHGEIPMPSTETLPNHSFMHDFDYPCYAVPRFHLNASHVRAPLKRQHESPSFYSINVSPTSQQMDHPLASATIAHRDKPNTSLHAVLSQPPSPFRSVDPTSPTRCLSQPGIPSPSIQMNRFFPPLSGRHIDQHILPPGGFNVNRLVDYSSCEPQVTWPKQPKAFPVSPAAWLPRSPSHSPDPTHTALTKSANVRKMIYSPAIATGNDCNDPTSSSESTVLKLALKRSFSHPSPPTKIKEEGRDLCEGELMKKRQKVEMENGQVGNTTHSPPMPVIGNVFSLAPYQAYLQVSLFPSRAPQRTVQSSEHCEVKPKPDIKEKMPNGDERQSAIGVVTREICPDTSTEKSVVEILEHKNIKKEKIDPSDTDTTVVSPVSQMDYSKVTIKEEPEESCSSDSRPMLVIKKSEPDEPDGTTSLADGKETSDESKAAETNSYSQGDACTLQKQVAALQSKSITPPQASESKLDFKNIPPQCLKLSTYNILLPDMKHSSLVPPPPPPPPGKPPAQPKTDFIPKLDLQVPVRKHFLELHHSLCKLISKSVSASSEQELRTWMSQLQLTEPASPTTKVQKVTCLLGVKAREVWLNDEMKSALHKVLERLREYTSQERCPFPHVMRTGAVFLPMLVTKELLFPMVLGSFIDQVLHEHKVELRPTTLSEEKILIQLHKRACSSRLRRLMSLKHLPDIYPDVVNLLHYACVCKHLGLDMDDPASRVSDDGSEETPLFSHISASPVSPPASHSQRHPQDLDTKAHSNTNRTKSRVKSSSRRMFLDYSLSDEEEADDTEKTGNGVMLKECCKKNWMCPLSLDELSPSPTQEEGYSSLQPGSQSPAPAEAPLRSENCSGVILKLRRMFSEGLNRKKACYQAVSSSGTSADPPLLKTEGLEGEGSNESNLHRRTPKAAHRWQRTGGFSHALRPLSSSSKRNRSLLKIKYCPYLSACHSAEHRRRWVLRSAVQRARRAMRFYYPDLVGKRIRHLYEEDDKSEVWYRGEVLRVHEANTNPLKTLFEVRYDSEPEWKYYLELLIDYKKGWLKIED